MTRRSLITLTLLALPALALAHPGHSHKTMGVVSAIHENHLEIKDTQAKTVTFTLDAKTRVRRGKTILTAADIKTGDRVIVVTTETKGSDGKAVLTVSEIQLGTATR